MLQALSIVCGV